MDNTTYIRKMLRESLEGSLITLYHGSGDEEIYASLNSNQFYSANDYIGENYAQNRGGYLYEVEANLNPLVMLDVAHTEEFYTELFGKLYDEFAVRRYKNYGLNYVTFTFIVDQDYGPISEYAKSKGFNSIKFWDESFDGNVRDVSYMVFDGSSVQIKQVYDVMDGDDWVPLIK